MAKTAHKIEFCLNGDGMTNVHPQIITTKSSFDMWFFEMSRTQFFEYLSKNNMVVAIDHTIVDEDGYEYGKFVKFKKD